MPETTGDRLRAAREAADLTQKAAADRLGVTQTAISDYETGRRPPDLETVWTLASIYDADAHDIDERLASKRCCGRVKTGRKKSERK